MLVLEVFGKGRARYQDQPLVGFPGRQPWLLLCYLLLHRRQPQSRERLAAVFWRDYPTSISRKHLRNTLWRMRRALQAVGASPDEYLVIDGDSISFSPSGPYSLDVEQFETTIHRYQHLVGPELTPETAQELEQAVALYSGELLSGIYEDWCLIEGERVNLLYLDTLSKLMNFYESQHDAEKGLACGRRILACDNTREKVHRQMMRLYWLSGDRSAALAQYDLCFQILADTLGVAPLPETTQLYHQMRRGEFEPTQWEHQPAVAPLLDGNTAQDTLLRVRRLQALIKQVGMELTEIERQLSQGLHP